MELDEIKALADKVFGGEMRAVHAEYSDRNADIILVMRDEHGEMACVVKQAGILRAQDVEPVLESHRHGRRSDIGEWNQLLDWSHQLADLLEGKQRDGEERWRETLPPLMVERFTNDFRYPVAELEGYVKGNPPSDALIAELRSSPTFADMSKLRSADSGREG